MPVELSNEQRKNRLDGRRLQRDARRLLEALDLEVKQLSILLTDDRRMASLHEHWMGEPGPTDVLSFPGADRVLPDLLGDIAISVETAARRLSAPRQAGLPVPVRPPALLREVRRYLVHGVLHLAGYDHHQLRPRRRMQRQERRLRAMLEKRL